MAFPDWDTPLSKQDVSPRELVLAMNEINALPVAALAGSPNKGPVASNPVPKTVTPTLANPFVGPTLSGSPVVNVIGVDPAAGRVFATDKSFGGLAMTDDYFATAWKNGKTLPPNVANGQIVNIFRFGANVYAVAKDTTSTLWGVYKSVSPASSTNDFAWGAQANPLTTGTVAKGTESCVTSTCLLIGEYGDPVGGPSVWRSTDGTAWTRVYGPDAGSRHIHAIAEDPYNLGTVYMTIGDNGTTKSLMKSTDGGVTWNTFVTSTTNLWQSVQISFTPTWIWLASDRIGRSVAVCDRAGNIYNASKNWHKNVAVPFAAAATDAFYTVSYMGIVDPATGIYYCIANDTGTPGNTAGLFYLPEVGGYLELIAKLDSNANGQPFIAGPNLWFGYGYIPLLPKFASVSP